MPEYASGEKDLRDQNMQGRDSRWRHACLSMHPDGRVYQIEHGGVHAQGCIRGEERTRRSVGGMHTGVRIRREKRSDGKGIGMHTAVRIRRSARM
jgi:hypothetical protein